MSKSGMNWLLAVAVTVAAGAIGAGAYYLSKDDASLVAEAEDAFAKLEAAANGNVQLNSSGTQTDKVEANNPTDVTAQLGAADIMTENVPSFDVMRVEPSGDAVVAGRAQAGSIVALISNGDVIGRGIANTRGEFAIVLDRPLTPGDHDVSLEATNNETQEKSGSAQHIAVSVPENETGEVLIVLNEPNAPSKILQMPEAPVTAEPVTTVKIKKPETEAPTLSVANNSPASAPAETQIAAVKSQAPENTVAPTVQKEAQESTGQAAHPQITARVEDQIAGPEVQPMRAAAQESSDLSVKSVETSQGKVFVAGESKPDAKVRVYVGEEFVGEAKAGKEGRWLVEAEKKISAGNVEVRADRLADTEGKVAARAQVVFTKGENDVVMIPVRLVAEGSGSRGASASVGIGELPNVIIRQGDNLWTISRRLYGKGTRYTTIYQANSQQIRNPDLIYPGQVFMLPVADLNWKTIQN
ncbi:LysM domain/BON superfamily protein [Pseudovibrio axinellae]|uniref:LysM domain/BON superfamily protein n=1 Tax=Pseudovibrio axinellae TaxID=989403 RepID=A0A165XKU0_9HYPH|nr:Ig-like domain-containing protein [Pseudovibrio axinellae]KZL17802.1 LysM domain/BON superfamily protein [Pseudovibrio axinellae]SEP71939.1 Nucleoid-associated protein YgaU, contains BON and LysM domains [Pseudovibrio axinellae]